MKLKRVLSVHLLLLSLCVNGTLQSSEKNETALELVGAQFKNWEQIRLVKQEMTVVLSGRKATFKGTFTLTSSTNVPNNIFAFPFRNISETEVPMKATIIGAKNSKSLELVEHVIPKPRPKNFWKYTRRRNTQKFKDAEAKRNFGEQLRLALGRCGLHSAQQRSENSHWYAYRVPLKAGKPVAISVEFECSAIKLADSEDGPCHMFQLPLRIGHFYGTPTGTLSVMVSLSEENAKPENTLMLKPAEAKQVESTIALKVEDKLPDDDLIIVLKNIPKEIKPNKLKPKE